MNGYPSFDFESKEKYNNEEEFEDGALDTPCFRVILTKNYMDSKLDTSESIVLKHSFNTYDDTTGCGSSKSEVELELND